MNILFISWDGPQVSYLESLFLPIFHRLSRDGYTFHILQFTWGDPDKIENRRRACAAVGVPYRAIIVKRRFYYLGTLFTLFFGAGIICKLLRHWSIDLIMPRSIFPSLALLIARCFNRIPILFDADGLPLDERVEFYGMSENGLNYRILRKVESLMLKRAERIVTRTNWSISILADRAGGGSRFDKFHVIGNGRDPDVFAPISQKIRRDTRNELKIGHNDPLIVYAGSLGAQYCLSQMYQLFTAIHARRIDAKLLILTGQIEVAKETLRFFPSISKITIIKEVPAEKVPSYIASSDLGLVLRQPTFSMNAISPIKLGEYLLCGIPVVLSKFIGDTHAIDNGVGYFIEHIDNNEFDRVAEWFCKDVLSARQDINQRCRQVGLDLFSLENTVKSYGSVLELFKLSNKSNYKSTRL